jgi:(5-formylfuran-3-yl)methyl phosphate synthase
LPSLLVSVRSPQEARAAVAAGADIIDVKEPSRGSLGRAEPSVWQAVRAALPRSTPLSVALGELTEWLVPTKDPIPETAWSGIDFCKLGLASAPAGWVDCWARLRHTLAQRAVAVPNWVAVIYLDWQLARAPHPDCIVSLALEMPECRVVLFDTWSKSSGSGSILDKSWSRRFERIHGSGRKVALAGSLDCAAIELWKSCGPDIFAVRGAACSLGDRLASIDAARVARLVVAARAHSEAPSFPRGFSPIQMSNRTP